MIDVFEFYHGAALTKLLNSGEELTIQSIPTDSNATFSISQPGSNNTKNAVSLYIKYSRKRRTPWVFTFKQSHQEELKAISEFHKDTFLVLVCGSDGIVTINYKKVKKLLDEHYGVAEWIKAHRFRREQYQLTGSDGKLDYKISKRNFPEEILDALKK